MAITGVFCEHWFEHFPSDLGDGFRGMSASLIYASGCMVQLFFLLSGYNLTMARLNAKTSIRWRSWLVNRGRKILVPFWIACFVYFVASRLLPESLLAGSSFAENAASLSLGDLAANLTLIRNQIPSARSLNDSFWFIPVIMGLYLTFPLLFQAIRSLPLIAFLLLVSLVQVSSTGLALLLGWDGDHSNTIFLFHLVPFAVGMSLAVAVHQQKFDLDHFRKPVWLVVGVAFIAASLFVSKLGILGRSNNDILSAVGLFLGSYFVYANVIRRLPLLCRWAVQGGKLSYIFYLIHLPLVDRLAHCFEELRVSSDFWSILLVALTSYLAIMAIAWMIALIIGQCSPLKPTHRSE